MKKLIALVLTVLTTLTMAGCGSSSNVVLPDSDGFASGELGDTMRTCFFDYTVNSAYLCDEYAGYTAADGYELLVADVTIANVGSSDVEMYDTDFQIQWGDDADDAFDFSLTFYSENGEALSDEMLPAIYTLSPKESRTGLLVFEIPKGYSDYSISYMEYFNDDSTGDTFFVYFNADKK